MNQEAMYKLSYGLFILTTAFGGKDCGCIINTAMQVTAEPNKVSICVNKSNYTCSLLEKADCFTVSVIDNTADFELFKHFGFQSGKDTDKFADFKNCKRASNGTYYITRGTNAYISVKKENIVDLGTHLMFIGKVTDMEVLSSAPSATYEYYLNNIKPKPTQSSATGKTVWRCKVCGYEYEGETLPDDFICPLCKHPASDFEKATL